MDSMTLERNNTVCVTVEVMEEQWDYLMILDACRYDYFAGLVQHYISGELERRASPATGTLAWCMKSFGSYYPNVIYVSGNPYINSKTEVHGFDAKRHFYRIIDVWKSGWDERLGTVPPGEINRAALSSIQAFPEKRFIIHYLQPHAPYISQNFFLQGFPTPSTVRPLAGCQGYHRNRHVDRLVRTLGAFLLRAKLIKNTWELRQMLGLPPVSPMDAVRRKHGVNGLRQAYKENLSIVLAYAAKLSNVILENHPLKKIVITADHGEFLGEDGKYFHSHTVREPILVEVPWFKVNGVKETTYTSEVLGKLGLPVPDDMDGRVLKEIFREGSEPAQREVKYQKVDVERERVKDRIKKLSELGKL